MNRTEIPAPSVQGDRRFEKDKHVKYLLMVLLPIVKKKNRFRKEEAMRGVGQLQFLNRDAWEGLGENVIRHI